MIGMEGVLIQSQSQIVRWNYTATRCCYGGLNVGQSFQKKTKSYENSARDKGPSS